MSIEDITNPLQYIECVIAFDSRDWAANNRLATIYAIVFGFDDEGYCELQNKYYWSDIAIKRLKEFHKEWERLREERKETYGFQVGQYIIYHNGSIYEIGRIKSLEKDGAFVAYHCGETGSKTRYADMHPIVNDHFIEKTTLGGDFFGNSEK